ncbi:hypothetical protein [Planktothricoides raciborskii]|uniref:Lipoprotein n=1 Tax=Planktothricoides raciborskii FACHB-1370 TaxID=2949576 RepID=A0ABR8EBA4_9CYAN|nr:hypothetical protein [Planktothricoides raciborskii]MBD2544028.1 hypothetical protein [Planktothricoides raciborskii FACHB-1370]MBD2582512.1 hypothetical protein [Planktothricoides raciborskii FACHB-1261]
MMRKISLTGLAIAFLFFGNLLGCSSPVTGETKNRQTNNESAEINMQQNTPEIKGEQVTLTGVVIRKSWNKSYESWNAGGGDYFVLDVGDTEIAERSAEEGVILRGSDAVDWESFADYEGQRVQVEGYFIEAQPYIPQSPMEQYPMGMDGKPLPRGSGFQVDAIQILN